MKSRLLPTFGCLVVPVFASLFFSAIPGRGADGYVPFDGEKSTWHDGFERFDYVMDEATLEITAFKAPEGEKFGIKDPAKGQRRCVVVVPKEPAPGNPWSWQGCYWDHEPQTEVELLRRGFHVAYISANAALKPGKEWDAWYAFLTEKHGLSKKPAFVGMSRGGEYSYTWATAHPDKVSCIYGDNPGYNKDVFARLGDLAAQDVPLLHVCGSIDPILGKGSTVIEEVYQQLGGRISILIKDGAAHHPHSLRDPKPIADFITQSVQAVPSPAPDYLGTRVAKTSFYSAENVYRELPSEKTYVTVRGPYFTEGYDRYSFELPKVDGAVNVIAPKTVAPGKPWVFRAGFVDRDAAVDLALLARGYHIVTGPVSYNTDGPVLAHWNAVYQHLTDKGFAKKPVMEGAGRAAGEVYAWAIENPDKVACVYAENPVLRSFMVKGSLLDRVGTLAAAGVPLVSVCGSRDPGLGENTRALEKRYQEAGGTITVLIKEGEGHFPLAPKDPKAVAELIVEKARTAAGAVRPAGKYVKLDYPASTVEGELQIAVTYTMWIPADVKQLRGIIVHQHGAGTTASIEGSTAAYDLHWQALAKKWDCALIGPSYHVLTELNDLTPGASQLWFDPRRGSDKAFLKALRDLGAQSGHPELETVPWAFWGHSGGGIWADVMTALHPEKVVAVWMRSGSALMFINHAEFVRPELPAAYYTIPMMTNPGVKEKPGPAPEPDTRSPEMKIKGPWPGNLATFREVRAKGGLIGFAPDPRTGHECGDSRYLAIPYLDACLAMRLPDKGSPSQALKPVDTSKVWLASVLGETAQPLEGFGGKIEESVWLPNEAVARAWMEYVKTGAVGDTTPPPAPTGVQIKEKADGGAEITWQAAADFESGIGSFIILRDGQEVAKVPENPVGKFGRPLFQSMTYHDTPSQPMPAMRWADNSAKQGEKHIYTVIAVNSVGLKSGPADPP